LLLALGIGVLVERLVVTDTEAVEALIADAFDRLKERDVTGLRPLLSDDFEHRGRGPDEALAHAQGLIDRHKPTLLELRRGPVVAVAPRAQAEVDVKALAYGGGWIGRLRLTLRKESAGWRIVGVEEGPVTEAPVEPPGPVGR
jgi:hypothetical protein